MTNISVIILVGREELHIRRCLERLAPLEPRQVFVVESQQGDRTHEVAVETARQLQWQVKVIGQGKEDSIVNLNLQPQPTLHLVWHDWPGTQAAQFNWALDYVEGLGGLGSLEGLEGPSEWILRLDADEYLTLETIEKLRSRLKVEVDSGGFDPNVAGVTLELKRRFCGGEIRHATNGIRQVRLFRRGKARYAETKMDERLMVDGAVVDFDGAFYDDNLNDMDWWREKHRGYTKREAQQAVESLKTGVWVDPRKAKYYKLPRYVRAFAYFAIRYFLKGGFLDGYAGWMWNFWQGLWYRLLVDREISCLRQP